jgi:SAM-dependent methyltransferase
MRIELLEVLCCPDCAGGLFLPPSTAIDDGCVQEGSLCCARCHTVFPIVRGIPRFVEQTRADESFGFQWNTFRREQLDSENGVGHSARRLWSETGWDPALMPGRLVLDVGCGAGRFLEVAAASGCRLVGVDLTNAIDAAALTVRGLANVDLVQADVFRLPFKPGAFDDCYFIGVAQHTPDPAGAIRSLPPLLKPGGRFAVSMYPRRRWTHLNGKYLLRPITTRMNSRLLMASIKWTMPFLFPLTEVLFRLPGAGRFFAFAIPVANYTHLHDLTLAQRYRLALLDTFDRLAPQFDCPLTEEEVLETLAGAGLENLSRPTQGAVNLAGTLRAN